MPVTLCMIVKNEEAILANCLRSVRDWVDEMVVVDTGSTDGTVALAESFGARVEHFTWCDDFAAARNYALEFVKTPWLLTLDADDILLNPEDMPRALEYARKNRIDGIYSVYKQEQSCFQRRLSLFKPKAYRWEGAIHESPIPRNRNLSAAMHSDLVVEHQKPRERGPQAARQYLDIIAKHEPENWLGLAESYKYLYFNPDDPAKVPEYGEAAEENYLKAAQHPQVNDFTRYYCHFQLSQLSIRRARREPEWYELALRNAQMCVGLDQSRAEGWTMLGICWKLQGRLDLATEALEHALRCEMPMDTAGLVFPDYYGKIPAAELKEVKRLAVELCPVESPLILPERMGIITAAG